MIKTELCEILKSSKRIAVVGISRDQNKISHEIAKFLQSAGYEVCGVNPFIGNMLLNGIQIYNSLTEVPFEIDIINVFRKSEDIPSLIPDVLKVNPKVLWLQLGIRNDDAVKPAVDKGITTIQDKCIYVVYNQCKSFLQSHSL